MAEKTLVVGPIRYRHFCDQQDLISAICMVSSSEFYRLLSHMSDTGIFPPLRRLQVSFGSTNTVSVSMMNIIFQV